MRHAKCARCWACSSPLSALVENLLRIRSSTRWHSIPWAAHPYILMLRWAPSIPVHLLACPILSQAPCQGSGPCRRLPSVCHEPHASFRQAAHVPCVLGLGYTTKWASSAWRKLRLLRFTQPNLPAVLISCSMQATLPNSPTQILSDGQLALLLAELGADDDDEDEVALCAQGWLAAESQSSSPTQHSPIWQEPLAPKEALPATVHAHLTTVSEGSRLSKAARAAAGRSVDGLEDDDSISPETRRASGHVQRNADSGGGVATRVAECGVASEQAAGRLKQSVAHRPFKLRIRCRRHEPVAASGTEPVSKSTPQPHDAALGAVLKNAQVRSTCQRAWPLHDVGAPPWATGDPQGVDSAATAHSEKGALDKTPPQIDAKSGGQAPCASAAWDVACCTPEHPQSPPLFRCSRPTVRPSAATPRQPRCMQLGAAASDTPLDADPSETVTARVPSPEAIADDASSTLTLAVPASDQPTPAKANVLASVRQSSPRAVATGAPVPEEPALQNPFKRTRPQFPGAVPRATPTASAAAATHAAQSALQTAASRGLGPHHNSYFARHLVRMRPRAVQARPQLPWPERRAHPGAILRRDGRMHATAPGFAVSEEAAAPKQTQARSSVAPPPHPRGPRSHPTGAAGAATSPHARLCTSPSLCPLSTRRPTSNAHPTHARERRSGALAPQYGVAPEVTAPPTRMPRMDLCNHKRLYPRNPQLARRQLAAAPPQELMARGEKEHCSSLRQQQHPLVRPPAVLVLQPNGVYAPLAAGATVVFTGAANDAC
jgi:hypothetical protein